MATGIVNWKLHKEICKLCGMTMEFVPIDLNTRIYQKQVKYSPQFYFEWQFWIHVILTLFSSHHFFRETKIFIESKETKKKNINKMLNNSYKSSHCNGTHTNTELNLLCALVSGNMEWERRKWKKNWSWVHLPHTKQRETHSSHLSAPFELLA